MVASGHRNCPTLSTSLRCNKCACINAGHGKAVRCRHSGLFPRGGAASRAVAVLISIKLPYTLSGSGSAPGLTLQVMSCNYSHTERMRGVYSNHVRYYCSLAEAPATRQFGARSLDLAPTSPSHFSYRWQRPAATFRRCRPVSLHYIDIPA